MNTGAARVLLIDDDDDDVFIFRDFLRQVPFQKFHVHWAATYDQGKQEILHGNYDVCFLDYRLESRTGLDFLKDVVGENCTVPIILLTGYGEREVDFQAMRLGAADYLVKDQINAPLLERSIRYSIHRARSMKAILDRETQILVQDRMASVGLLASSLAHEIGTPLGVMRGRAEILQNQLRDNPEVQKNSDVIISQIDRISKLIRSLLNLARGQQTNQTGPVKLNEVISEVTELMGYEFRRLEINLTNKLAANSPLTVKAETGSLHQVLLNLLVNAVHAVESAKKMGRATNSITISAEETPSQVKLKIADTGCGISKANMKNLFKPFFTTKEIGVGTGLGLATSYRIVESWGGSIEAKSTEGEGAEFQLILPRA